MGGRKAATRSKTARLNRGLEPAPFTIGREAARRMRQDGDPFDLERFVAAQAPVIESALAELRAGRKRTHWMWFVFPQIAGLGSSGMAVRYAIGGRAEAQAYLAHPLLGERLRECVRLVIAAGRPLGEIFGSPDDIKFRSCVTLFSAVALDEAAFREAIQRCCGGARDAATLTKLGSVAG